MSCYNRLSSAVDHCCKSVISDCVISRFFLNMRSKSNRAQLPPPPPSPLPPPLPPPLTTTYYLDSDVRPRLNYIVITHYYIIADTLCHYFRINKIINRTFMIIYQYGYYNIDYWPDDNDCRLLSRRTTSLLVRLPRVTVHNIIFSLVQTNYLLAIRSAVETLFILKIKDVQNILIII